jgi:hypothetical protein
MLKSLLWLLSQCGDHIEISRISFWLFLFLPLVNWHTIPTKRLNGWWPSNLLSSKFHSSSFMPCYVNFGVIHAKQSTTGYAFTDVGSFTCSGIATHVQGIMA